MSKYLAAICLSAVAMAATSSPAFARKLDFAICDGLEAPKAKGDGMRPPASSMFFSGPDAAAKVRSCTDALADPLLLPSQPVRRASLLRSRAVAHLAANAPDLALADVDAALALSQPYLNDPMFARTMGLSLQLVKAFAFQQKGQGTTARALALSAAARRPYSLEIQQLTSAILRNTAEAEAQTSPYLGLLPLQPQARNLQFSWLFDQGRFGEAIRLFDQLDTEFPDPHAELKTPQDFGSRSNRFMVSTMTSMQGAYAFAASGRPDRAEKLVADVRKQMDATTQPAGGILFGQSLETLKRAVDMWAELVQARARLTPSTAIEIEKAVLHRSLPANAAGVEFLTALRKDLPEAERAHVPPPEAMMKLLATQRKPADIASLARDLPDIEFSQDQAAYKKSNKSVIDVLGPAGYRRDGFRSRDDAATGLTTVEFVGNKATASAVDEMTLLYAADLARQKGKTGFVIAARRDFTRTWNVTRGFDHVPVSSSPAGFKTELDIRFVDLNPSQAGGNPSSILDADKVYTDLAAIYIPAQPGG
ncbi:hypothetical protein WBP06_04280 [Novosphingobium sp. BL-8H]|uniref:hypothetical protein n=1 Tax=Novosphingobium sp. BL-8H TaxID=3127640 RepID=UPI003757DF60